MSGKGEGRFGSSGGGGPGGMEISSPKKSVASLGSGREKLVGAYAQFEGRGDEESGFTPPLSPGGRADAWH